MYLFNIHVNFIFNLGVVVAVAIIAVIVVVLLIRSGKINPPERIRRVGRAITRRIRESRVFARSGITQFRSHSSSTYYVS